MSFLTRKEKRWLISVGTVEMWDTLKDYQALTRIMNL